jgi:hypothetical protein
MTNLSSACNKNDQSLLYMWKKWPEYWNPRLDFFILCVQKMSTLDDRLNDKLWFSLLFSQQIRTLTLS